MTNQIPVAIGEIIRVSLEEGAPAVRVGGGGDAIDLQVPIQIIPLKTVERIAAGATFTQATPSTLWIINHSFGTFPIVQVRDTSGNVIIAEIHHVDTSTVHVSFNTARAGTARLF